MVILIIDKDGVGAFEGKCQTPISANIDRPVTREITMKLVKLPARSVHILGPNRIIKGEQLNTQFLRVLRLDTSLRSCLKELLDTAMPEVLDH